MGCIENIYFLLFHCDTKFMPKNHVLHARITDDIHSKLTEKCNEIGCSITDYVVNVLDDSFEEEHDVKMDYVITQKEIIKPSPRF